MGALAHAMSDCLDLSTLLVSSLSRPQFLKDPKQFASLDAKPPKGILLEGDPGEWRTREGREGRVGR